MRKSKGAQETGMKKQELKDRNGRINEKANYFLF